MTLDADTVRHHLGNRVTAEFSDNGWTLHSGILKFVTPDAKVVISDPDGSGREHWYELRDLISIADARFTCAKCEARTNTASDPLDYDPNYAGPRPLCASCYREWAYEQPPPIMACPECGSGAQAFYSPRRKKFACPSCHGIGDGLTGLGVEARFLAIQNAACRAQPHDDPRHDWVHVRGHRWHCQLCEAKRFTDPVR